MSGIIVVIETPETFYLLAVFDALDIILCITLVSLFDEVKFAFLHFSRNRREPLKLWVQQT